MFEMLPAFNTSVIHENYLWRMKIPLYKTVTVFLIQKHSPATCAQKVTARNTQS